MTDEQQRPVRAAFTQTQQLQAQHVGQVTDEHRQARRAIPTFPIDNVAPEIVSDRDDGVFVEAEQRGGGYRVHVTIADVAAHVRAGSPLAAAAWQRAFTLYGPGWTDPMFPKTLEESLSLEHHQERLGITVSITLDANYRPVHTSFTPVITRPDNSSYAQAEERMVSDPQFKLMAEIADGIQQGYFGGHSLEWESLLDKRREKGARSERQVKSMHMVATYMLLANSCVAEFFSKSGLPFLYRNFDETRADAHATYGVEAKRHTALEGNGLKGAYCHFTSPIRRAPDYFNGVMVHHVIDVLGNIEQAMQQYYRALDSKALHRAIWAQGPELLASAAAISENPSMRNRIRLQSQLQRVLTVASPHGAAVDTAPLRQIAANLQVPPHPLSKDQLTAYAEHMNALAHAPETRAVEKLNARFDRDLDRMEVVEVSDKDALAAMSREKFSLTLQSAAATGIMNRALFNETRARLRAGTFDKVQDGFNVFLLAQHHGHNQWTALKREVANHIKHEPAVVNALYERLERHVAPATVHQHQVLLPGSDEGHEALDPSRVNGALIVMRSENAPEVAAPFYSVGHNKRAALSHARYSFIEHYAFAQLQPLAQTAVPNLLYAELDMAGDKKRELLGRMAHGIGADLVMQELMTDAGYRTVIEVRGGELMVPIRVEAEADNAEEANQTALRRMLRNDAFKTAVGRQQDVAREVLNPQKVLEDMLAARGGKVQFHIPSLGQKGTTRHRVEAHVMADGNPRTFHGHGPNVDRAMRAASVKALAAFDWQIGTDAPTAKSWVSDMASDPRDNARGLFAR